MEKIEEIDDSMIEKSSEDTVTNKPKQQAADDEIIGGGETDGIATLAPTDPSISNSDGAKRLPERENEGLSAPVAKKRKKRRSGGGGNVAQDTKQGKKGKKIRKRRSRKEEGGPKWPLTGYVRFMNKRRDELRIQHPTKTAIEHTKMIGEEWNQMSDEDKKPFLEAAEADKERYTKQLVEFHKQQRELKKEQIPPPITAASKKQTAAENQKAVDGSADAQQPEGNKKEKAPTTLDSQQQMNGKDVQNIPKILRKAGGEYGIPIFTDEFLEHNKIVDSELKLLRKSNIDYEQQNSVLEKHIENMKIGVEKIENENTELEQKNLLLETYLKKLKCKLTQALSGLAIPTQPEGATSENISNYMSDLQAMATSNSHGPAVLNKAKDIIRKLDLQIQL